MHLIELFLVSNNIGIEVGKRKTLMRTEFKLANIAMHRPEAYAANGAMSTSSRLINFDTTK